MGGFMHLFDFNQGSMARKILSRKRHVGGLEAPRNSLELQVEASQNNCDIGDGLVEEDWSEKYCYPIEASMKRLINEENSKKSNTRQNAPSIVARLMGVDMLPLDTKSIVQPIHRKNENAGIKFSKKEHRESGSIPHCSSNLNSSVNMIEYDSVDHFKHRDADRWSTREKLGKPQRREHPQEEELQKFKKEFEAWQAARLRECSRAVELGGIPRQLLAQENLNKEKLALHANSRITECKNHVESKSQKFKARPHERGSLQHRRHRVELFPGEQKESVPSRSRSMSRDFERSSLTNYDQKMDKYSAPTRIVILKPGPDRICDHEESWTNSSGTFEERGGIEEFLEEVKERLKCELQGKNFKRGSVARGSGIETPFSEKPSDPKKIARHIAKKVRENVTRDLGMNLLRSESTRSYRSEIQCNELGSPEFINRDTRKFLSERLRNVLNRETHGNVPIIVDGSTRSSILDNEKIRLKQVGDTSTTGNVRSYWEIVKDEEQEMQTRSFRHEDDDGMFHRESSPRNLIRSLSAPVSGTSFGKLLLEDRHILTGAHIRRKSEVIENVSVVAKKRRKEKFNLKEKVSNFRYSLILRRRLFGRKIQSMAESYDAENYPGNDIMSGPTVVMNFGERHENPTEVPPSPASVCSSSVQEEFWRPADYLSPISTPDVTLGEDNSMPQVFREISANLNELRRQLNKLESDEKEDTTNAQEAVESEMADLEDQAEAYTRDLLVASGLYDGSSDKSLSRWDPLAKPISNSVFEEVEESYRKLTKDDGSTTKDCSEKEVDHKVLLGLLNEALSTVLGPPLSMSRFRRKIIGSSMLLPPRGRKLLDCVWKIIHEYLYPPADNSYYSLDSMVARDLRFYPWSGLMDDEISSLGKDIECQIVGDLVEEIVKDMHF